MSNKFNIIFICLLCSLFVSNSAFAFDDATLKHEYTFGDLWNLTGTVQDSVGNSNGTVVGGVTRILNNDNFLEGTNSCAVANFNEGYILLENLDLNETDGATTSVTFWLKWEGNVDDEDNRQMPFSWDTYDLLFRGSEFGFNSFDGTGDANNIYGIDSPNDSDFLSENGGNNWVHIAAVFTNGDVGSNEFYVNGELQTLSELKGEINDSANNNAIIDNIIAIGGHTLGEDVYPINGAMGNFRIYDGVITEAQVTADMNDIDDACSAPTTPTLIHQYTFQDLWDTTTEVQDSVGNSDGTAIGDVTRVIDTDNFLGLSSSCSVADFTANEGFIELDSLGLNTDSGDTTSITFWMKWAGIDNQMPFSWNEYALWFRTDSSSDDKNFGFNSFVGNLYGISSAELSNQWVHVAAVFRDSDMRNNRLYINGVAQELTELRFGSTGDAINDINAQVLQELVIGGNTNPDVNNNFSFEGRIGNFRVYDGEIGETEVLADMNNIADACPATNPVLDMRFDESSWADNTNISVSNAVIDSSGNDYHGTAFGNAAPIDGLLSCNAADFTTVGIEDYISVNYEAINGLTDFSVVFWGKQSVDVIHDMVPLSGSNSDESNELLLFLNVDDNVYTTQEHINGDRKSATYAFDNEWHQYTWTRDASTQESCIYYDGQLLDCGELGTDNPLNIEIGGFILGQEQDVVGGDFVAEQAWDGLIDELLIFPTVLNQADIELYRTRILAGNDWQGNLKSCAPIVDHFRFELPNSGVTCQASDVVLKACENESCSSIVSDNITLTLSPTGQWGGDDVNDDAVSLLTGTTSLELSQPTADTVNIGITSFTSTPTSASPVQCYIGSTNTTDTSLSDCSLIFKDTGFLFSTISTQISNKPSSQEFNGETLTIQAVQTDDETGACEAVFPENGDIDIELKLNCVSGDCSDIEIITDSSTTSQTVGTTYNNISFQFDNDSLATYELTYPDAGQLSFSAQKTDLLTDGALLSGTSNNFVVKPFGFKFEFPNDSDPFSDGNPSTDGDFTIFKKAGEEFTVNAIAIGWQVGEDVNNDGNIDDDVDGSDNSAVQFFTGDNVSLDHELLMPTTGNLGILTASDVESADSSASFVDINWSEVGVIKLIATLSNNDYLGTGLDVRGVVDNVGRFTPSYLEVIENVEGNLSSDVASGCSVQTFVGEMTDNTADATGALTYHSLNPSLTIAAKNTDGDITQNYAGDFFRFDNTSITFSVTDTDSVNSLALTADLHDRTIDSETGTLGSFTYTMSDEDNFFYTRDSSAEITPFSANISHTITELADQDDIGLASGASLPIMTAKSTDGHLMYYARIKLTNAFGSEEENIALPMKHQIFDGTSFVVNSNIDDSLCSYSVEPDDKFTLSPTSLGSLSKTTLPDSLSWTEGEASLLIFAPGTQGSVEFEFEVESWLQYDWDNTTSTADTNPTAIVTFGRYRGNDRIINWRENR